MVRCWSAASPRTMMPPTAPHPKPRIESCIPVRPKVRICIAVLRSARGKVAVFGCSLRTIAYSLAAQLCLDVADHSACHHTLADDGGRIVIRGIEVEITEDVEIQLPLALQMPF